MKRKAKALHKNKLDFSISLSIILIIMFNNETLLNNLSGFKIQPVLMASIYLIILFIWRLIRGKHLINIQLSMTLIAMISLVSISIFVDGVGFATTNAYSLLMMSIIVGYIISLTCNVNQFLDLYSNTIYILSFASILITYIFKSLVISMPTLFPIVTNSAGITFSNAYITYIIRYHESIRNYGIFREPGVFAIFIVIAIAYQLRKENINILKLIILTVALITTFSVPGYIALIILVIGNFNTKQINAKKNKYNFITLFIACILITASWIFGEGSDIFSKISTNHSSFNFRVLSIIRNIEVWIMNPIFGSGIINGNILLQDYQSYLYLLGRYHNTSTLTSLLVYFGAVFAMIYFVFLYRFCKILYPNLFFFVAMILLLNSQLLIYNPIIYALIMFGAKQKSTLKSYGE